MYEIRLIVNRQEVADKDTDTVAYIAHWAGSYIQESKSFPLVLPLTEKDTAELRWYLEAYYQLPSVRDHIRGDKMVSQLKTWGCQLFNAVFNTPQGMQVYNNLMDAAQNGETCIVTLGSTDPKVLAQPWEMMRDKRGPLVFRGVTIRRQLRGTGRPRQYAISLPLRVLLIVSRPKDMSFIEPRNSIAPLLDALEALPDDQVRVDLCEPATLARLEQMISEARKDNCPYHIVHFDGHGAYGELSGVGQLAFEREDGTTHLVTGGHFGDLLARIDVPLVLLEACRGSDLSDKPVFGSLAPALLESGVGSVIAFSHAVHIRAVQLLVERIYAELVSRLTIGQALAEARACLYADPARWLDPDSRAKTIDLEDWFVPQLYQVGDDPVLIMPESTLATEHKLRMTIDLEHEKLVVMNQRLLRYGIAGFLEIPPSAVRITVHEEDESDV